MKKMIVKKDYVTEVQGVMDYIIEKFNLGQLVELLEQLYAFLLSQISSYPMLKAMNEMIEKIMARLELFRKVSII